LSCGNRRSGCWIRRQEGRPEFAARPYAACFNRLARRVEQASCSAVYLLKFRAGEGIFDAFSALRKNDEKPHEI